MRTKVLHETKKKELVEQIWNLFMNKGYEKCTMAVILQYLDISKGEFYHYFQSKEDCAKACAVYYAENCSEEISLVTRHDATPLEKLFGLIKTGSEIAGEKNIQPINSAPNHVFHQMVMAQLVRLLSSLYSKVFIEGNELGEWEVSMPTESAEMFLTLTNFYLDDAIFGWDEEQMVEKTKACLLFLATMLGKDADELYNMFIAYCG